MAVVIFILLLVILANYSKSGFKPESEYIDLVYKMLSDNETTMDIIKVLQGKGAEMDKIPTYMTMGQVKLLADKPTSSTTKAPQAPTTMEAQVPAPAPAPAPA